jgi:hypothetical protein
MVTTAKKALEKDPDAHVFAEEADNDEYTPDVEKSLSDDSCVKHGFSEEEEELDDATPKSDEAVEHEVTEGDLEIEEKSEESKGENIGSETEKNDSQGHQTD